jgi:predicted component of type VI protein secretion system
MELVRAPDLFQKLVCSNGAEAVELLEQVATLPASAPMPCVSSASGNGHRRRVSRSCC